MPEKSTRRNRTGKLQLWLAPVLAVCCGSTLSLWSVTEAFAPRGPLTQKTTFLGITETESPPTTTVETISVPTFPHSIGDNISEYSDLSIWNTADENDEEQLDDEETSSYEEHSTEASAAASNSETEGETTAKEERLSNAAKAAALLARRKGRTSTGRSPKATSVGERRVGSASRARQGSSSTEKLMDAVRKSSSAKASESKQIDQKETKAMTHPSNSQLFQQAIHSTVSDMLDQARRHTMATPVGSMGLFGEPQLSQEEIMYQAREPVPGKVLVQPRQEAGSAKTSNRLSVRVATRADDYDIANLRLSVFSDFSVEMRKSFCSKSAQILDSRRKRGATCLVATVPRYGSILSSKSDVILGSAECSEHEFLGTNLGQRRPENSLLYVTEVAVSPAARRKGVGFKMMEAVEKLAEVRGIETIYLHVDVANYAALVLYERAGFEKVTSLHPMYYEFTKSLNLHDGATKGRKHFLLQKHLKAPTWLPGEESSSSLSSTDQKVVNTGTLGIEV